MCGIVIVIATEIHNFSHLAGCRATAVKVPRKFLGVPPRSSPWSATGLPLYFIHPCSGKAAAAVPGAFRTCLGQRPSSLARAAFYLLLD